MSLWALKGVYRVYNLSLSAFKVYTEYTICHWGLLKVYTEYTICH